RDRSCCAPDSTSSGPVRDSPGLTTGRHTQQGQVTQVACPCSLPHAPGSALHEPSPFPGEEGHEGRQGYRPWVGRTKVGLPFGLLLPLERPHGQLADALVAGKDRDGEAEPIFGNQSI